MCWPGSWHFSKSILSAEECGWQRLLASCQCFKGWPLVVRCPDSLAYKECASLQRWSGLDMSNVWKHPKKPFPRSHNDSLLGPGKFVFLIFSSFFTEYSTPRHLARTQSAKPWRLGPWWGVSLMAAFLGFILHSGVCEAEITSYTFFPLFF